MFELVQDVKHEHDYELFKIRTYSLWDLFMHEHQHPYVGRCYAWARRDDAKKVTDMTAEERNELFDVVIPAWNKAVSRLFSHDWTNVACFGNTSPHLHWHLIPRYRTPRNVYGIEFVDPNPKGNYSPYKKMDFCLEFLLRIRDDIKVNL